MLGGRMGIDAQSLQQIRELWERGQGVAAGQSIFERIEPADKPKWAASVLQFVLVRRGKWNAAIAQLIEIADDPAQWKQAKQLFLTLRDDVLELEGQHVLSDDERALLCELYLAENVAKVIYNATDPPDEYDADSGWWIAECLRCCINESRDNEFAQEAWLMLVSLPT